MERALAFFAAVMVSAEVVRLVFCLGGVCCLAASIVTKSWRGLITAQEKRVKRVMLVLRKG